MMQKSSKENIQQYEAPQGEMEENLARVWCELFTIDRISRHDNFFALGGHSLLIVKLLAQLRQIGLDTTARKVFDAPTLATLASSLYRYKPLTIPPNMITKDSTNITPEMLPLINLSQADIDTIIAKVPGGVASIQDIYGLTPSQNDMLYQYLKAKTSDSNLFVNRLRFVDRASLERYTDALQQSIQRHDILRTAIFWKDLKEPAQVVLRHIPSILTEITVDKSDKSAIEQLSQKFNPRCYRLDLRMAQLLRLLIAPTTDGSWVGLQLMHHLAIDDSTLERLLAEIQDIMDGNIGMLPVPTPFRQFVAQSRSGINPVEHVEFFTEMLGDIDEPTLPFSLSNLDGDNGEINEARSNLPQTLNDQLRAHARNLHVSLASMCHLAWAQVVAKATGRDAVVFGTALFGHLQTVEWNHNAMGPLKKTLPLRLNIDDRSAESSVRDTHICLSALLAHEKAPLLLAQSCSGVPSSLPLFSSLLNYHHSRNTVKTDSFLHFVGVLDCSVRTNYPLTMSVKDSGAALSLMAQVVSTISAARICEYLQQSLESLVNTLTYTPQQSARKLTVMPSEERTLLLHNWNQITVAQSTVYCIHQLFEAQVKCDGNANVLNSGSESLTYSQLNTQANRLAHYLIAQGVKPDDRIALCVERSIATIVGILGIVKAGGAYVPLDPAYPSQRLNNILLDADPVILLADVTGHEALGVHQIPRIDLDKPLPIDLPIDNLDTTELGLTPAHLAYVIYTSGSTGKPKGVMIEHQQIIRLFESTRDTFNFNKQDKWCLFNSISFDVSIWEIWSVLLCGSQLSIVPYNVIRSTEDFYDWICTNGITVLNQPPSAFEMVLRVKRYSSRSDRLRYALIGGEGLNPATTKEWYEECKESGIELFNMYGTTETAVQAIILQIGSLENMDNICSIGRQIADLRVYLLDSQGEPVLLGAEGEIYIGGACVGRGYLNRPELTGERFLPDPFNDDPVSRMYRTGDLARYLPDGNLMFLGRIDQQVKIRGFRIELGEIEARLVEHPNVREAVVQSFGIRSDARLVAYVVADEDELLVQNLRSYLSALLPEYMVPAAYVCLPSLPLTPNGKVDKRALPAPDDKAFVRQEYEAPQGQMEEKLAGIWRDLLSIDRISRHDNFFALGGHSLLIVRLLTQLRQIDLDTTAREVFDAPTLASLASTLHRYNAITIPPNVITKDSTEITPEMLPLINLSQADIDAIIAQVNGGVANIQDIYGLTSLQNGILYHHLMAKEGDPYLLVSRLRFTNRASLDRYTSAVQQLIERHDILRTSIYWDNLSEPAQVVLRQVPSVLTKINISNLNESVLEQLSQKFSPRRYRLDLKQAPLLRIVAASEPKGNWVALQLMHHSIIDHLTHERLQAEIRAIMDGKFEMLVVSTPFRQFVAQTRLANSPEEHTRFFTEMLSDIDEPTLPFGLIDIDQDGIEINEAHLKIPPTLSDQLQTQARNLQVSLASIYHLAWAQVLAKASGCEAVVFGTVLLGRLHAGDCNNIVMGPMINTLPMRLNIDNKSIEPAVRNTHAQLSALLTHEHAPLVLAQRCSNVPTGLPLFNALMNYRHNEKAGDVNTLFPGVSFVSSTGQTTYPITLSVDDNDSSSRLTVQIVAPISAERICTYMQQSLQSLNDALINTPQKPIRKLRVMPPEERTLLLHSWNTKTVTRSPICCLHKLFETRVESNGQAIAVECEGKTLSYSDLNMKANRLAHYLIRQGVKPDDRIALCVERSSAMIVAMLGIMKAGGAYLPLDPANPSQRLTNILEDADPVLMLADTIGRNALGDHQISVLDLETPLPSDLPITNPDTAKLELTPAHLAYVIYTSGSTGTPKGVMIEHRKIVRLFEVTREKFDFNQQDKWCLFHSFTFDVSVWEIWAPLLHKCQLFVVSHNIIRSTDEFFNWICTNGITVLSQTPSAFKMLMRMKNASSQSMCLRYVILAGEALDPLLAKDWYEKCQKSGTILVNMYGPTETAVYATFYQLQTLENIQSIGRPLPDLCAYLLDSEFEPVLLGAEGELYVSGAGVARGYLNRSKLTAERFLPDPFNGDPEVRMYRTGDLARFLPDGNLMFLGRIDQQVKIRGFRIELGEIEVRLLEHPNVHEAAVVSHGNGLDMSLVAYVVADAAVSMAQNLRTYLSNLLPDYMVPAAYVCLPSLPLTPSGKLDRRALPAPNEEAFARQQYEAPRGEIEEKLADIWRELLSIDRISRHDNFFALGGHSLLIVRLLTKLRQIDLDTTARKVFDAPTLATLASTLRLYKAVKIPPNLITKNSTEITPEMLPLIKLSQADIDAITAHVRGGVANIQDIYGLTSLQNGILYHHLMAEEGDIYLLVSRLRFVDRASLDRYTSAVQQLIERHDILRTAIFWDGLSEPAQVVLRQVPSILTEVKLDDSNETALEQLSRRFSPRCYKLDLTQPPLLRLLTASEVPASDGSWVGLQLMHHSIIDHSTLEKLQAEIQAIMNGKIEILTPPTQFRHFVAQDLFGMSPTEHTRFFTEMLSDIDEPTLPFGLNNVDQDGANISEAHLKLSQILNDQLREHARNLHVSLASMCHLAWAQVLAKACGRETVVFGTILLGRLQSGEDDNIVMGPMINTLPFRVNIGERSVETVVRHTHTRLSALLAHEHASLVLAQRCGGVPDGRPLFSTLLNYRHNQNCLEINTSLPGVCVLGEEETTNYPLALSIEDDGSSLGLTAQVVSPLSAARICAYMLQTLQSMNHALTHTKQLPVSKLTVMPPEERELLLQRWNRTTVTDSPICCLHEIFEEHVKHDEHAIAVEYEGEIMTYSELNSHANQLAHHLIGKGVKPDELIALCAERSIAMIVAMMGILKAGCAYVPLDPTYTSQRLNNILRDANPVFLLVDSIGRNALGDHHVQVIDLEKPLFTNSSTDNPDTCKIGLTPANLAYVIYTSGSTGTPKGVMVEHQQVVRLFESTNDKFDFNKQDRWCLFHSISFDFSVWEIWNALLHGSQLSIVPYKIIHSTNDFYDWVCTSDITVLNQTPSAFKMLMRAENISSNFHRFRYIVFAGEKLDALTAKECYEKYGKSGTIIINIYGPTETTVYATFDRIDVSENICSIGRPLPHLRVYLLDSQGEPVLLGAEGEIYISGAGVSRGYLKRPELTEERFLSDPFNDYAGARMYRTGDLARYMPDGNLMYLGRVDQQVKIRGFRIELGEIEARLVEHPCVHEAVVQSYGDGSDARLVAYVVADADKSLAQNLRSYLSNLLPDYMVPSAYVCLTSLPLTASGKLDRRALPAPNEEAFARQQYEAPQSEMEEKLADIWRELLCVDSISRHDNFFALGGHSLLIVQLLTQLRRIGLDTTAREVFDAPTLATLASTLCRYRAMNIPPNMITKDSTEITPEMLPLINLSQADIDAITAQVTGGVANIQDIYGLTPLQSGMLYHHLIAKEGDPYLIVSRLRFDERSSLERYTIAFDLMIKRHDILRTAIFWDSLNESAQVVFRQVPSVLTEVVLDKSSESVLEQLNQKFNPRRYRLDLTEPPLIRLLAAPESDGSWTALQLMHHSLIDHSALESLQTEIHAIMDGGSEMSTTTTQFRNFVAQVRLGVCPAEHTRFFTQMLGDIDEPTLPFGLSDVSQDGGKTNEAHLKLSLSLNDQLRAHARNLHVSLASICHLAWAQVLAKACGREAVVFGTVLLGRLQSGEGNDNTMGPMINSLPLRLNVDDRVVENAVRQTHAQLSALFAQEHAPLVLAQRCSGVPAGLPLFSSLLNYRHNQDAVEINTPLPGVTVLDAEETTNYPLTMSVEDNINSLGLTTHVISPMAAANICAHMQQSLESLNYALALTPELPVRKLTVMPTRERTLLLHSWNQIKAIHSSHCCLHDLFEEQVKNNGAAIAVECDGNTLSYSELNTQANELAHYLIAQGVEPDNLIALCAERSTAMIVGLMSILKAGCAYVPLDPVYPSERLTNILRDANPVFLLADTIGRNALNDHLIPVIDLEKPHFLDSSMNNLDTNKLEVTPAHLAYVIYTSGSTGIPKGVMVEHQQVVRLFESTNDQFDFDKQDKWCMFHSISFDVSVWEIWGALLHGSQLSIVPHSIARSTDEFHDWIFTNGITVLSQTPSAFKMLLRVENVNSRSSRIRYIIFAGEELDQLTAKECHEKYENSGTILVNMYGTTETTVHATFQRIETAAHILSIGRPLSDLRAYLLNSQGEPVLLGAEGEIYISGEGVTRGYLNRLELTVERFLPDPFNDYAGARMYRTGDLARYLPDGNLVYLGRIDQQVKIRGFRIELGEIEARLVEHSSVKEAVVLSNGNGSDTRLVAYVVADKDISLIKNLRTYLSKLLPDYMVPVAYVCLPSLPLTASGKLDRRALPAPDDDAFARQEYEAPQGEIEEKLADIWRELLSIDRISRHDNFFSLGGHSLLIVKLFSKLRQIGLDTTAREVFGAPTLATLASSLCRYRAMAIPANMIPRDSMQITPEMLPLINLSQADIASIVAQVRGGVANIQDIYGLTPFQSGVLYHHLMAKEGDPYLLVGKLHFLDRSSMEHYAGALQQITDRNDILRTGIFWDGLSEPAQVVLRQVPSLLTEIKLDDSNETALEQLSHKFSPRCYRLDLTQPPLLRLLAAPESDGSWVALQLMHHSIIDHLTLDRLYTEINVIMAGKVETLTVPTQFRQFVAQARLGMSPAEHTRFFTEMLSDIDEPTLPFGLNDVDQDGTEIHEAYVDLSQTLNEQLRAHARNLHVSLASICHLAWAQVLARACGHEAVVFGTVLLGRLQTGESNNSAMGPMINTLPFRVDIFGRSVEAAVRHTHARLSSLLAHEHASLVLAQRCSGVPASLPLFSAILNYRHNEDTEKIALSLPGVRIIDAEETTNYPLGLSVEDDSNSLGLTAQVISPMSAARICTYMEQSLESLSYALTHTPQLPVRKLVVMPSEERELLVHGWNQTTVNNLPLYCLHELFEAQVKCDGQATALECEGKTLSYSELNMQANQLAHYLIAQGVKPDDRIALCFERSTAMIVAIMGIIKAGCAYVPLDPTYPSQRLTNILVDADPIFLVADFIGGKVLGDYQIPVIDLEQTLTNDLPINDPDATKLGVTPAHLAYVIYTSGSTGTPKGVMVEHNQVVRLFVAANDEFDFDKHDNWCLFHSISFDVSVWEMWGVFLYGSQLSIIPHNIIRSTNEFHDWICTSGITVLNQTPLAFKMLMRAEDFKLRNDRLRYIFLGGEVLDPMILIDWYENYNTYQTTLINLYGPTEAVINTTSWIIDSNVSKGSIIPIGRPLFNKQIYLLDAHCEPVLLGAEGEIYISGAGVARGYLNRPELSVERFLPDPFSDDPEVRMYRTGDLARYMPDGNVVFLGRKDQQVKIRGFRIELGEIEARLVEHPNVREAIVQSYGDGSDARLVAYVVANADELLVQNLRSYLSTLLPDYMIPAAYVCLSSLPLTSNGKLDRRALPAPDDEAFACQQYEAPQGEMEEKLADIWRELLSIDRVSRHDNFFALGGHSLLIVQLLTQLRQIGLDTTAREVFDAPTLATLASTLDRYKAVNIPPNLIPKDSMQITPEMLPLITLSQADINSIISQVPGGVANIQDIYGLTPLQNGMLFDHLMAKEGDPYTHICQISFIDRSALERYKNVLQKMIERHDILRTAFFWDSLSEPAQVVLRQVSSVLTELTFDSSNETTLEQLSRRFSPRSYRLNLTQAPLLRLLAAPSSEERWVALQLMHHTTSDHSTLERLLIEIYDMMHGKNEMLAAPTSFRQFVAQVRMGMSPAEHTRFFTEMLGDIDEPTLPFDLSNINGGETEVQEAYVQLSQTLNDQLRAHARNLHVSLASMCHLAWAQVLAKACAREAVVFGTVLLGRLQSGVESHNTMGPMINALPLRLNIDETDVETAVRHTHAQLSALLTHEHAPLVLAQRCSGVSTGLPLFSSLLNYRHNQQTEKIAATLPGVRIINTEESTNYPLTISVEDNVSSLALTTQVISTTSAARICAYMKHSMKSLNYALTHTPQMPVRKLAVMPLEESELLLRSWNRITVASSPLCCLHDLFEAQVECDGQAISVECDGNTLSYSELNSRANQLAHYLIARGVKPDNIIALCAERSTAMIIGMIGILKAGCAYLPLDPVYQSQRLTNILRDANPVFLLADSIGRSAALGDHQIPVIDLEKQLALDLPTDNPNRNNRELTPANLAYVIYTSGSTGAPNGVMVEHQQVVRLFQNNIHDKFDFNKQDKWCMFHSISFDVSVWEIWGALSHGSQLSIVPHSIAHSTDDFYYWICTRSITILNLTPSAFKILMRVKNLNSQSDQLRYIIFAGEELDQMTAMECYKTYGKAGTILVNMYGPTETAIYATFQQIKAAERICSIGQPLPDLRVYLLDAHCEPVLLGAEGEIFISGAGVARGYLNRPELSVERFLPDPFSDDPEVRMYRTGDLARYLPDGNLMFLGRKDQQVKIRGFRIELGEIEARLVEHSSVKEAVVVSCGDGSDARLVAYVIADADKSLAQNLRSYLMPLLPDYMVPAAYVCLPSLPLTASGKLNRRALPAPDDESFARQQYEAPQGEIEGKLADIWRELLNIDRISRHDNFFELGGHSLLVMNFVNKAKLYDIHIDARGVFSLPILENLAEQITKRSKKYYCDIAIPARQYGNEAPLFLLADGSGDISYAFELSHDIDKSIPVYVLQWSSPEDKQPSSIEEMAETMIVHIKKVCPVGPCAISAYSGGGILAFEIAKQLLKSGYPVSFLGLIDTYAPTGSLLSETEVFLMFLRLKFPAFKEFNDSLWWTRVSKLTVNEAIEEIRTTNLDLNDVDIKWEALLSMQRCHYQNICTALNADSLPIKIHLFKALDYGLDNTFIKEKDMAKKLFNNPKLGWENYNLSSDFNIISVDGDHFTMMTNPKYRCSLGKKLTMFFLQNTPVHSQNP